MERKNAWKTYSEMEAAEAEIFSHSYKQFLDNGKTERECVAGCVAAAEACGFRPMEDLVSLAPGDRVYVNWMNKCFMAFVVGSNPIEEGMNILGAHIDSPRLDIKQNPLYEEKDLAYLDTHYYGGIKKYQWVAIPLALHGVICKKDGTTVTVSVGEKDDDPVFCISDLLPHLGSEQMSKNAREMIPGEDLNVIVGGQPLADEDKDAVKANVLKILQKTYGVKEEDFLSAELEVVPAGHCRDMGFDRSMLLGYGHDDRVCAYPSMRAVLEVPDVPAYTACCVLTDKEEIGSAGATGMESHYFENTVAELIARLGAYSEITLKRCLRNSRMLSSDVSAAFDPNFASVFEGNNAAYLGRGVCFNKYTGSRGKSGSNDANAEYIAYIRRVMDEAGVNFQTCELGKVDAGGGGTIAYICAKYCMNVIDCGVPVLSMHAPWEIISKADLFEAYKCYSAFVK